MKVKDPTQALRSVAFTPDGRYAVVASTEGHVSFFDPATGALVRTVSDKQNGFFSLIFSRKGDVLITGTADGYVLFWDMKSLGLPK